MDKLRMHGLAGGVLVLAAVGLGAQVTQAEPIANPILRGRSLQDIQADCDPATGAPRGMRLPPGVPGVIINPTWYQRPEAKEVEKLYPKEARKAGVSGRAVVRCRVGTDGRNKDCQVVEESPEGHGFGAATLKLAERSLSVPQMRNCVWVDSGVIQIPLSFSP